jgi:hypothetical protein
MTETAPTNISIRMPTPLSTYNISWANNLVSSIDLQNRSSILAQNASNKATEDIAEALTWFYA